jgi:hypothetical protein
VIVKTYDTYLFSLSTQLTEDNKELLEIIEKQCQELENERNTVDQLRGANDLLRERLRAAYKEANQVRGREVQRDVDRRDYVGEIRVLKARVKELEDMQVAEAYNDITQTSINTPDEQAFAELMKIITEQAFPQILNVEMPNTPPVSSTTSAVNGVEPERVGASPSPNDPITRQAKQRAEQQAKQRAEQLDKTELLQSLFGDSVFPFRDFTNKDS